MPNKREFGSGSIAPESFSTDFQGRKLPRLRVLMQNLSSSRDEPPANRQGLRWRNDSPEFGFLASGELLKLVKGDLKTVTKIALSLLRGEPRNFTEDSALLAENLETAHVLGRENIPVTNEPLIVACNHPDIYDVVAGTIHVTNEISRKKNEQGFPGDIHWLIADHIPPRDVVRLSRFKLLYGAINTGFKLLHKTYGDSFVPVPMSTDPDRTLAAQRSGVVARVKEVFKKAEGSKIVGIFPEGDITKGSNLDEFHQGVGKITQAAAQESETSRALVLPVGMTRDATSRLIVHFGEPLEIGTEEAARSITTRVRDAVCSVVS